MSTDSQLKPVKYDFRFLKRAWIVKNKLIIKTSKMLWVRENLQQQKKLR